MILVLIYSKLPKKINNFKKSHSNIVKIHYFTHFKNIYKIIYSQSPCLIITTKAYIHQAGTKS
jgi:hypothetical protein